MKTKKYGVKTVTTNAAHAGNEYPEVALGTVSVPFSAFARIVGKLPTGKQKTAGMNIISAIGNGYAKLGQWFQDLAGNPLEA